MAGGVVMRCFLLLLFAVCALASHFRGGIIMVRPKPGEGDQNEMEVFFHISWRRSFGPDGYCDQSIIDSGALIGSGDLECQHGCSGTISSMAYRCTDFSTEEDWSFGEHHFTHVFNGGPFITVGFTGGDWLSPFDAEWNVSTTFSTTRRNDTGRINSTPRAITAPVLRLQAGCNHIIRIPVYDPENDVVRCRWAEGTECAGICGGFPGAELDSESCSITYHANQGEGHRAAAIMIEDYLPGSTSPMSSIGLQFLVLVFNSRRRCSVAPEFIPPTFMHGSCVAIPSGESFHTMLIAVSGNSEDTIAEIQTVSPAGMEKSDLFHDEELNAYYVNITWAPEASQETRIHLFCFTATNSAGLSSSQVCIELLPGHVAPAPVQSTATPNFESVHPSETTWHINFDRDVKRPSSMSYITFHEADTGVIIHRIDTSSSSEITFEKGDEITIAPNHAFEEKKEFYINFEQGVAIGLDGCGPGNEPVTERGFWVFATLDVTPPNIRFLVSPRVSNVNISLSWESDEEVTWECNLSTDIQVLEVECSNGFWNGFSLAGGSYELVVSGTDTAGNTGEAVHAFTVDVILPIASITRNPAEFSNLQSFRFQFRCNEICTFQCQFHEGGNDEGGNGEPEVYAFPCNSGRYTTPSLSHGKQYTFSVTATDQVGNTGESVSHTWETDFEEPIVFGVMNARTLCTGDLSPASTGQAQAVDNQTAVVGIRFSDRRMSCSIQRTWRATDSAGNVGFLVQHITLEFNIALNFIPLVSVSCDSSRNFVPVPQNTATVQNPCRRPIDHSFEDSVSEYICPITFTRTWTVTDRCDQQTASFDQTISLYDLCPIDACGRNETPTHGICIRGRCSCNDPWFGENCDTLIYSVRVEPVNNSTLLELEDYSETLILVQGTPPVTWTLISAPDRMAISQQTREITWRRSQAGNYQITVEVRNQVSTERVSWSVHVKPGYNAFLDPVSEHLYARATAVELNGHVEYIEGNIVEEFLAGVVPVTIEISSRNGRRELKVFTRRDGTFSTIFYPVASEYGSYAAGAKHPRASRATEQTAWDFLGMKATPRTVQLRDSTVAEFEKIFHNATIITNDGPRTLHGLKAVASLGSIQDLNAVIKLNGPSTLEPGQSAYMDIEIKAEGALEATFPITLQTMEGVTLYITVNLKIAQILPRLVANPPSVNTRIVRGTFKNLEFNITNVGSIPAHMVRAVLPMTEFISLVSFGNSRQQTEGELTLGSGESATLSVLASAPPEQPLGDVSGQIVISSVETFRVIRFNLLVSSDILMNLTVIVEDEYTYFAEGRPLLSNAAVRLVNNKRSIRETLITGDDGTVTFVNIPEDRYEIYVTGPNHVPVDEIIITSAEEPIYTVFLARRAVTYSFTVVPTTFEETYTVTLEADFETHVPIPVVTITPRELSLEPYELGLEDIIQYNITNHGLIRADDVGFELPDSHPFLEFTTDIEDIGSLDALTSIIVPVKVTRIDGREKRNLGSCVAALFYAVGVAYAYVCGDLQTRSASAVLRGFSQFSDCGSGGRPYGVVSPSHRRFPSSNDVRPSVRENSYSTPTTINCNKCIFSALGCLPVPIPFFGCAHFAASLFLYEFSANDLADHAGWIGCILSIVPGSSLLCIPAVLRDCLGVDTSIGRRKRSLESTVREMVEAFHPMLQFTLLGIEVLGDERWIREVDDSNWLSQVLRPTLSDESDLGTLISSVELANILSVSPPQGATFEMVEAMVERFNNTLYGWINGELEPMNGANMASFSAAQNYSQELSVFNERLVMDGYPSFIEAYNGRADQFNMVEDFSEDGVCAVVRIRIEQEVALTREAFLAKLEIENKELSDLQRVQLEFKITNVNTAVEATLLFSISNETLSGALTSRVDGWTLPSSGSGAAEWLIVPFSEAAPTDDQDYNVGGTLTYFVNNENISVPLLPTRITVMPDPSLVIHYFWEKYVIGDNPFTEEREPSVPFALGVAIHNAGYGVAMNLHITSGQPEIIENEKGLLVTFKIIGVNIGSESVNPSLAVDFGDIPANTTRVARWLMISSLQGEFKNYSASFEYMNPLGDPKLSVLDELEIHDLIRNVFIYQEDEDDGILDFLVNDESDLFDFPDALYSSKTFTRYNVSTGAIESVRNVQFEGFETQEVRAISNYSGWVYFRFEDMRNVFSDTKRSINVTKPQNDVTVHLPPENAWITRERQKNPGEVLPLYLHIFDYIEEAGEITYTLNPCTSDCPTDERPFERAAPPVPPINVEIEAVGSTWITVSWEQLLTSTVVSNQSILVSGAGIERNVTVDGSESNTNVTDLPPGTVISLRIIAVAEDGQMSFPSVAVTAMTYFLVAPSAPVNLQFESAGDSWITFSWEQDSNGVDIVSQIISIRGGQIERNVTVEGDETHWNTTGLQPGTEYTFRVTAVASDGQMSSQSVALLTTTRIPSPVDLITESVGLSWILLSWQPMSTAASYIVAVSGHGYEVNYTVDGTENRLNVTSLEHGTEYALSVIAVATNGATSTPSVTITATTTFPGPPAPEDILAEEFGSSWIVISWSSNTDIRGYIIVVESLETGQIRNISIDEKVSDANITGLQSGMYTLRVLAVGVDGQLSPPSSPIIASTTIPGPSPPQSLTLESVGVSWIAFSWDHITMDIDLASYIVTVAGDDGEVRITVDGSETSVNVTTLQPGTEYTLKVISVSVRGQMSPPSVPLTITTSSLAPAAPINLEVDSVGFSWIAISWQQVPMELEIIENEILIVGTDGEVRIIAVAGTETMANVTGLQPGTEYTFTVSSESADGQTSPLSEIIVASTLNQVLPPEGLSVDGAGVSWIYLSWDHASTNVDISMFIVTVSGAGGEVTVRVNGEQTTANVTGLQPGTQYTFTVIAVERGGQMSASSNALVATTLIPALDIFFINDTPRAEGGSNGAVFAQFSSTRQNVLILCRLRPHQRAVEDCSTGTYRRENVPPGRYTLRIEVRDRTTREKKVITAVLFLDASQQQCAIYLINRGYRVEGRTFTVEFSSTGAFTGFTCILNKQENDCSSPLVLPDISPGRYSITVQPRGCSRFRRWKKVFQIQ